jgi:hypothetical protein
LLGDLEGIVDLDPKVSDRAFELGVSKQELNNPKIPRPSVVQRGFDAPQLMGAVSGRVEPNRPHPGPNDPEILPGRKMRGFRHPARKPVHRRAAFMASRRRSAQEIRYLVRWRFAPDRLSVHGRASEHPNETHPFARRNTLEPAPPGAEHYLSREAVYGPVRFSAGLGSTVASPEFRAPQDWPTAPATLASRGSTFPPGLLQVFPPD